MKFFLQKLNLCLIALCLMSSLILVKNEEFKEESDKTEFNTKTKAEILGKHNKYFKQLKNLIESEGGAVKGVKLELSSKDNKYLIADQDLEVRKLITKHFFLLFIKNY